MGRRTALTLGMPRRFADHKRLVGWRFREHYRALAAEWGPFQSELQRQTAADAAQAFAIKCVAVRAWEDALTKRATGTGRRPSQATIIRLSKRVALDTGTYEQACNRLQALLGPRRPPALADVARRTPVQA